MAVAADREEDRELVKNLGGDGDGGDGDGGDGDGDVRFGGFERESHLSLALQGPEREEGRKRERTSKSARRATNDHSWSLELESEEGRARGEREGGMA